MKKVLFFAVAALMLLATGCKKEPTEINQVNLPDKATVQGYVRYVTSDKSGKANDPEIVPNAQVFIYYGIKDDKGNMNYTRYDVEADKNGYFTQQYGVKPGQVIDEVKVQCSMSVDANHPGKFSTTYAYNKDSKKFEEASADYFAEVSKTNLVGGNSYMYDVLMAAVAYTSDPNLLQPGEKL